MIRPANAQKTGKVTIRRDGAHSMRLLIWARFGILFAGVALFFSIVGILSVGVLVEVFAISFLLGLLVGLIGVVSNKGTMVESVCFDYDNHQVVVGHTNMRNQHSETVIPYGSFHFQTQESYRLNDFGWEIHGRCKLYEHYEKKAVLVYDCLGWEECHRKRIERELEGFLSNKECSKI